MKKGIILTLVCLNVVLVGTVLQRAFAADKAQAQTMRGAANYIMVTGKMEPDFSVVYVIDLRSRRLGAWQFERARKRLVPFRARDLVRDFRRGR